MALIILPSSKANHPKTNTTLVRVHSECLTGDIFGSQRCDCGAQLAPRWNRSRCRRERRVLYMRQEGRGIGLPAKIHAYKLQEEGLDTVEANEKLGFRRDLRDYGLGAQILVDLGVRKIRFSPTTQRKSSAWKATELEIVEQIPIRLSCQPP